jgi:hypothetical protein
VQALIEEKADIAILDARRFDEYATMSIPGGVSAPGAELVLRARAVAPDPDTTIIVKLRRPHALHHRRAIAGECRAAQPRLCAAQRHDRLDTGGAGAGNRPAAPRQPARRCPSGRGRARAREVAYRAG